MKRLAFEQLLEWKNKQNRKPLIVQGARQVGKTWLMKEFGRQHYSKVAYISFDANKTANDIFEADYNISNIIQALNILSGVDITPQDTLIIFDEIQESERALNALKFFKENAPEYHIMAAGSLLGVAVKQKNMSFPVGQVEFLNLYPLSFIEFLSAIGEDKLCDIIYDKNIQLSTTFKDTFISLLKLYMYIGGMPEVVYNYTQNKNLDIVREIQNQILLGYQNDFSKYTESFNVARINAVWHSLPSQLAKENKKFAYNQIAPSARAREYEMAIEWLMLCGLVYKINRISKPDVPLSAYADSSAFKLYMIDTGLLGALSSLNAKAIIEGNKIFEEFKGALTEQFVLQELILQKNLPIAYWSSESSQNEIDFVIQYNNQIIPIEVKSSVSLKAKSLSAYREKYKQEIAIRTSLADFEINQGLHNIPLYLVENLLNFIEE